MELQIQLLWSIISLTGDKMKKIIFKNFFTPQSNIYNSKGYTLVELLVAMSVFVIITSVAVGGYVRGIKTSRQASALAAANSNISSALEQMMREIRTGFSISNCPGGCVSFYNLPITNNLRKKITYKIIGNQITRGEGEININFIPITDSKVKINRLEFYSPILPDHYPKRVVIKIDIKTDEPGVEDGIIHLQTTVSARN